MDGNKHEEYGRPRRPNSETVSYLNGLPLDEKLASEQVRAYVNYFQNNNGKGNTSSEVVEFPALVNATHAALSSVFNEVASLACEEIPAQQIETLVRISCRYSATAKRVVLASLSGYWVFLATHRFGSHVAQTVMRCAVAQCEVNLDEFDDKQECEGKMVIEDSYGSVIQNKDGSGGSVSSSVPELLLQAFEELKPFATDLTVHVCGSHVLRTALCILSGVEFVDAFAPSNGNAQDGKANEWESGVLAVTRRGKLKDKKKKKKRKLPDKSEGNNSENKATVMKKIQMIPQCQSADFLNNADVMLKEMVQILSLSDGTHKIQPPGELQQRICHPSGGPLIVHIVRLLSYRDASNQIDKMNVKNDSSDRRLGILPKEPKYSSGSDAEVFVHRLLSWDSTLGNEAKQPHAGDIIYGLSGEPRGSILIETILRSCPDEFHNALCIVGGFYDDATLREYINHGVSNFVVQALLNSVRSRNQANRMVKILSPIIEDGSLLHPKKQVYQKPSNEQASHRALDDSNDMQNIQRMGIVWRAFEMCSSNGSSQDQEQLIHALMCGFATINGTVKKDGDSKRKKRSKSKELSAKECIPLLLGLTASNDGEESYPSGERLTINAAGARTLHHTFNFNERLRSDWVNAFISLYSTNDLVKIANDGLASRCIMDGLLDGPAKEIASKCLYPKLLKRLPFLAAERVGHHVVVKLFRALPYAEKAVMSAELSHSLNRLGSNAMGRSVMVSCAVKEYLESENAWKEALAKQKVNEEWLKDIIGEVCRPGDEADKARKIRRRDSTNSDIN